MLYRLGEGYINKPCLATPWKVVYFFLWFEQTQGDVCMTTVMPQSELTRKAITWISEEQEAGNEKRLVALLEEAAVRFNLSPKDVEFLQRFYKEKQD